MKALLAIGIAALTIAAAPQDAERPIELKGKCELNATLPNMMKQRDGAERVTTVECDRVVIHPGKQAVFYKVGKPVATFEGHAGDQTDITMDRVSIGGSAPAATSNGRCRIYKNDNLGELMMLCFAVYRQGSSTLGVVATFSAPTR